MNLMKQMNTTDLNLKVVINLRACLEGEQFTPAGKCVYCEEPTYSIGIHSSPSTCQACPLNAICKGGTVIGPQ